MSSTVPPSEDNFCDTISKYNFRTACGKEYVFTGLDKPLEEKLLRVFPPIQDDIRYFKCNGFIRSGNLILEKLRTFLELRVRDDDVWVCSFPRSGTNWTTEMAWCIAHDADLENAMQKPDNTKIQHIDGELDPLASFYLKNRLFSNEAITLETVDEMISPRIFWIHVPFCFLPLQLQNRETRAKIIYVLRDPRDVCVSLYKLMSSMGHLRCTFDEYCELFVEGDVRNGPYWKHVESYLEQRDNPNLYISKYEDKIKDLPKAIREMANFLGKTLTQQDVDKLAEYLKFDAMKKNPEVNRFLFREEFKTKWGCKDQPELIRVGKIGQWQEEMDRLYRKKFQEKIEECFKKYEVVFK